MLVVFKNCIKIIGDCEFECMSTWIDMLHDSCFDMLLHGYDDALLVYVTMISYSLSRMLELREISVTWISWHSSLAISWLLLFDHLYYCCVYGCKMNNDIECYYVLELGFREGNE